MRIQFFLIILAAFFSAKVWAQPKTVTVINQKTNKPLEGVSVQSQNKSAVTDATGHFSIQTANGETITLSFVGMKPANVRITNNTGDVKVNMEEQAGDLEAVVVTGYKSERKKDLTAPYQLLI